MRTKLLSAAALLVAVSRGDAQRVSARAFESAWTPWAGVRTFGSRIAQAGSVSYRYKSSFAVGARWDHPLTRRTGLLLDAGVVPLSKQERHDPNSLTIGKESVFSFFGDATIGGRLKPAVPVFFMLGGGMAVWNHLPIPSDNKSAIEPRLTFGVGYDVRRGRTALRSLYVGHVTKPASTSAPEATSYSSTYDWGVEVGLRILMHDPAPRR